jgi:acylpyruvate hydrolase
MKLATIDSGEGTTAAVVREGQIVPIEGYADAGSLLGDGERGLSAAAAGSAEGLPPGEVHLRTPVLDPGAVFCVGLNYAAHIREMGRELPEFPTIFGKFARTLSDPGDPITLPGVSTAVDYEGELVVVIGAGGAIAGYTLMNDVSMRDWQYRTLQWAAGKNFERSTPVGPWIVTPDEFDPADGELVVEVNGDERQRAQFVDLVFGPLELVAYISQFTTLRPGDLIATGTPGGVGHAMDPPTFLAEGDVVRVQVSGLGELENRCAA